MLHYDPHRKCDVPLYTGTQLRVSVSYEGGLRILERDKYHDPEGKRYCLRAVVIGVCVSTPSPFVRAAPRDACPLLRWLYRNTGTVRFMLATSLAHYGFWHKAPEAIWISPERLQCRFYACLP